MLTPAQVSELRKHFPILAEKTYLYSCSQGACSDYVQSSLLQYAESWRTSRAPWDDWIGKYEEARAAFANFIHAKPEEVAIVGSATAGINPIANAISFEDRPRVVMGEYEFPTMGQIWLAQQARGAQVEFLDGGPDGIPIESYQRAIDRRTAIVPLTQVSFLNGFRSDVETITKLAHDQGALLFLDGFQDCGTRPIDVKALDADFYVTGTLKYLLGVPGVAFLYVREELIERMNPSITSWMGQRDVFAFNTRKLDPAPTARRFEGGSPPMPSIFAAIPALALLCRVGLQNIAAQIESLAQAFLEGARDLRIQAKGPADSVGPLVVLRSHDAAALVAKLVERNIVVSSRLDGVRFSFHFYNNLDDVNTVLTALEDNIDLMVRA